MTRHSLRSALAVWAVLAFAACAPVQTTPSPVPAGGERKPAAPVRSEPGTAQPKPAPAAAPAEAGPTQSAPVDEIDAAAAKVYEKIVLDARASGELNRDPAVLERVRGIVARLAAAASATSQDTPVRDWEANVITSKDRNAWCMPGGKIALYTGVLDRLQLSDDELAALLAHEMAHTLRGHGRDRALRYREKAIANGATPAEANARLAEQAVDVLVLPPYPHPLETEADRLAIELAARAGYDPRAAIGLWEKMLRVANESPAPAWLATHPAYPNRIRDLRALAQKALPHYQQQRRHGEPGAR